MKVNNSKNPNFFKKITKAGQFQYKFRIFKV